MATYTAYSPVDMSSYSATHDGEATWTESGVTISDGSHMTSYYGEIYSYGDYVYGTLRGIAQWDDSALRWDIYGFARDVTTFNDFLLDDDANGAMAYVLSGADRMIGSSGADYLAGFAGGDTVLGGRGNDWLDAGRGADELFGGEGRDTLDGGAGPDRMAGGANADVYLVDSAGDTVVEWGAGFDRVFAAVSFTLPARVEALSVGVTTGLAGTGNSLDNVLVGWEGGDTLSGLGGDDIVLGAQGADLLLGGAGDDELLGGAGFDVLRGGAGDDVLAGEWGRDVLLGGAGTDALSGGAGADVFRFATAAEIGRGSGADVISDFGAGDRIDLRSVDADTTLAGVQGFDFIEGRWFGGEAGELRFAAGRLVADLDGDGAIDMALVLTGTDDITARDLLI